MEQLKLPHNRKLQPLGKNLPYVFLGDSAFALRRHMMKPYPGNFEKGSTERIFNYRLSRARRVVENVFGIMASVFRVFRKPMALQPDKQVAKATRNFFAEYFSTSGKLSWHHVPGPDLCDVDVVDSIIWILLHTDPKIR
ncbi:uncharacterized protein LOC129975284 [Argiope bruennichi]|uniref:uncharacterized protein LOC129975284 n=1 Tax=Argiope bruennichi TaxID=94029 RepID=UPI002495087B|nr:uncharacterized protein LOC129975284 [Argiope bruennichi]